MRKVDKFNKIFCFILRVKHFSTSRECSDCINFDIDAEKPFSGMLNKVYVCMYVMLFVYEI